MFTLLQSEDLLINNAEKNHVEFINTNDVCVINFTLDVGENKLKFLEQKIYFSLGILFVLKFLRFGYCNVSVILKIYIRLYPKTFKISKFSSNAAKFPSYKC